MKSSALPGMKWWSDEISWMKSSALPWMKWWRDEVSFSSTRMNWWSDEAPTQLKKQNAFSNSNARVLVAPWVNYVQVLIELLNNHDGKRLYINRDSKRLCLLVSRSASPYPCFTGNVCDSSCRVQRVLAPGKGWTRQLCHGWSDEVMKFHGWSRQLCHGWSDEGMK